MIKQFKLDALFFAGILFVSFMGYSANAYAVADENTQVENSVSISDAIAGNHLNTEQDQIKLNKKVSLPGDKEFMPGIKGSEKDFSMPEVPVEETEEPAEATSEQAPVASPEPVAQPEQEAATPEVEAASAAPATQNVGTFKVSFYDPAVLGSNMGYDGVAANLGVLPRGTKIKITTAQGDVWYKTVNDTGTFANLNPHQIDVAMPNNAVPSYGITSATVGIVG